MHPIQATVVALLLVSVCGASCPELPPAERGPISREPELLQTESMLYQARELARRFAQASAKNPPPCAAPQPAAMLETAANWISIDLKKIDSSRQTPLASLAKEEIVSAFAEIGFQAVELKGLKETQGATQTLAINPRWGADEDYAQFADLALGSGLQLMGTILGPGTGRGADFALALKNFGEYPGLYCLIEIDPKDWSALPRVQPNSFSANIPWLTLQSLHRMGYVPTNFVTFVKSSSWNVTEPIAGVDGKTRRWIYLRDADGNPQLDWLRPSYASLRVAAGDGLQNYYRFGQKLMSLPQGLPSSANEDVSLMLRKIGAFSAGHVRGGLAALNEPSADLLYDHITPRAAAHALIAQDAEALRLMYRLLLEHKIPLMRLVHTLHPFQELTCDWAEFLAEPKKRYQYAEQEMTGEALRRRLIQEDVLHMTGQPTGGDLRLSTWPALCSGDVAYESIDKQRDTVLALHLLLARFFAWQPGAFCVSAEDLVGAMTLEGPIDLAGFTNRSLYPSVPAQIKTASSFSGQLKRILKARRDLKLERAQLLDVPQSQERGVLILRYQLPNGLLALSAVNFGSAFVRQRLEHLGYTGTSAINMETGLTENKTFDSSLFELKLDPFSAKLVLFQPTYTSRDPNSRKH